MKPEKILYTDGHEVTITETFIQVRKTIYLLKGIIHHDFLVIHPHRIPALLAMLVGTLTILVTLLHVLPLHSMASVRIFSLEFNGEEIIVILGLAMLAIGTVILGLTRERYAIRLSTAEGEKNVLVSKRKEYVTQVLDVLNKAFLSLLSPNESMSRRRSKTFVVSGR